MKTQTPTLDTVTALLNDGNSIEDIVLAFQNAQARRAGLPLPAERTLTLAELAAKRGVTVENLQDDIAAHVIAGDDLEEMLGFQFTENQIADRAERAARRAEDRQHQARKQPAAPQPEIKKEPFYFDGKNWQRTSN
jgi:hypothetical protein